MQLIGKLKEKVDNAQDQSEIKSLIADAGMLLSDDELSAVAGGSEGNGFISKIVPEDRKSTFSKKKCPKCKAGLRNYMQGATGKWSGDCTNCKIHWTDS